MASRDTTIMTGDVGKQHRDLFLGSILAVLLFEKVSSKLPAHLSSYGRRDNCDKRSRDIARKNVKRILVLTQTQTVFTRNCLLCFQKRICDRCICDEANNGRTFFHCGKIEFFKS